MRLPDLRFAAFSALVFASACGGPTEPVGRGAERQSVAPLPRNYAPTVQQARARAAATPSQELRYYGGKVVSQPTVYGIYWNNPGSYQAQLDAYMQTILPSSYFSWLGEYDTPTQTIAPGTFAGSIVAPAPSAATIDDTAIRAELAQLVGSGQLPAPDENTIYIFFLPDGTNVTAADAGTSCTDFCGYHDTFESGTQEFYYGVLPDPATCDTSCDNQGSNYFADLTSLTSHELTEIITDAEVGLAIEASKQDGGSYPIFPNAWTSPAGEIGDLCAWQNATVLGYNVQLEWSNGQTACVSGTSSGPSWTTLSQPTLNDLYGVWGSGKGDVYLVGDTVQDPLTNLLHSFGNGVFTGEGSGTTSDLYGIWGSGSGDVYVTGQDSNGLGAIFHSAGDAQWSVQASFPAFALVKDISGSGPGDIFALTSNSQILHSAGDGSWTPQPTGVSSGLRALWESAGGDLYAVGGQGTIVHYGAAGVWETEPSGTTVSLIGVGGSGSGDVYAVGDQGTILHSPGDGNWTAQPSGTSSALTSVWANGSSDVYVAGYSGTVLRSAGDGTWAPEATGSTSTLYKIWGTSLVVYAVGPDGTVLRKQ